MHRYVYVGKAFLKLLDDIFEIFLEQCPRYDVVRAYPVTRSDIHIITWSRDLNIRSQGLTIRSRDFWAKTSRSDIHPLGNPVSGSDILESAQSTADIPSW